MYKFIGLFFMLGCIIFALCNATVENNENDNIINEVNTLVCMSNVQKEYSNVKDIIDKYSPDAISALNTEELGQNENLGQIKQITLNIKSSIDKHLASIKQAKEQKEKEQLLMAQQEVQQKVQQKAQQKAKQEVQKQNSKSVVPAKAGAIKISAYERDLLERLVEAEAGGEPYEGKLAVATVVINRLNSKKFPNTIREVIYQKNQFSPVSRGTINRKASAETKRAVSQVVDEGYRSFGPDVFYFLNSKTATNKWIMKNCTLVKVIGNHYFYKDK